MWVLRKRKSSPQRTQRAQRKKAEGKERGLRMTNGRVEWIPSREEGMVGRRGPSAARTGAPDGAWENAGSLRSG